MKFWDTSAIVPLIVFESSTVAMRAVFANDQEVVLSWFTAVEASSAIWRRWRESRDDNDRDLAIVTLRDLIEGSLEISEPRPVAARAHELFSRHPLKAADALQLASALVAHETFESLPLVTLDRRLAAAAKAEGLSVIVPAA